MAHLDLHEQEQVSNLKYFWRSYGKYIVAVLSVALIAYLASIFWNWNSSKNAAEAAIMYANYTDATAAGDKSKSMIYVHKLQVEFPKTEYSTMASILAAASAVKNNDLVSASSLLSWVIDNAQDQGLVSIARLRLATIYIDQQKFDKAMTLLLEKHNPEFDSLYYTMRGDLYVAKGEQSKARDAYKEALQKAGQDTNAAQGIQMRLDVLGNN